jgi:flagellar basal-body rod protein FlgF/flagellar basal-body rod protein FlgG
MPYGLYLSAAGANAQSHRLEVLSHNLANINTPGFKPHLSMIQSRPAEAVERGEVVPGDGNIDDLGGGVSIQPNLTQFNQGTIQQTGGDTDFAINDNESFFVVQRGDQQLLTRAGNFLFDASGGLVTPNGDPVLANNGEQLRITPGIPHQVEDNGTVYQAGQRLSLMLVQPRAAGDLARVGDNLFQPLAQVNPVPDNERRVLPHALESSGVQPTTAMMELIESSRVYEANVKLIQTQDQAMGQLISRVLQQG